MSTCTLPRGERASIPDFVVPQSFALCEDLPPSLQQHADSARWLVSTTVNKEAGRDTDDNGFTHLRAEYLRKVMGRRQQDPIVTALTTGETPVLRTSPYKVGKYSSGFRLHERFGDDVPIRWRPANPTVRGRLRKWYGEMAAEQRQRWLPVDDELIRIQRRLTITDSAGVEQTIRALETPSGRFCQRILVDNIRRGCASYAVSRFGRRFNAITGLKRELRQYLRLDGASLASVDLRCAQPALLALLMRLVLSNETPAAGLKGVPSYKDTLSGSTWTNAWSCLLAACEGLRIDPEFQSLVCDGDLYAWLGNATGLCRDACKVALMQDFLAQCADYPTAVRKAFAAEFPDMHAFVRRVIDGKHAYARLVRLLQKLEAWLVVETVAPRRVKRIPIVTLHDCVFCRHGDEAEVAEAFRQVFDELDFHIGLKVEEWGPSAGAERQMAA